MFKVFIGFLALLAGIASSTQGLYNGYWKDIIGLKSIVLLNALLVALIAVIFFLISDNDGIKFSFDKLTPSILLVGACGFFIILIFAVAFPVIGATATSLLFIVGLLGASLFYDYTGALNLEAEAIHMQRIFGILFVIVGTFLALNSKS